VPRLGPPRLGDGLEPDLGREILGRSCDVVLAQVADEVVFADVNVAAVLGGGEVTGLEPAVLGHAPSVRQIQVDLDERLEGLMGPGRVLRAVDDRQLGAVVQQRVEVPPLDVRCARVQTKTILPRFDLALLEPEARVVFRAGG